MYSLVIAIMSGQACKMQSDIDICAMLTSGAGSNLPPEPDRGGSVPGLKELRSRKRLSLEALGYLANLDPATVSRIERGVVEASPRSTVALARALGTSVARMRQVLADSAEEALSREPGP